MISYKHLNYCYVIYDSTDRDIFDRLLDIFQIKGGHFYTVDETDSSLTIQHLSRHMTLEEIAKTFGVNRERIRQIEAKALRKLKHPSRSSLLRSFMYD